MSDSKFEDTAIEQVWGIPRTVMEQQIGSFQGFLADAGDLSQVCSRLEPLGSFRPRNEVEEDPTWKQVIPYIALANGQQILTLRRLSTQGEARLHNKASIGVGGHVNPEPPGPDPLLIRGMLRELNEEIKMEAPPSQISLLGWINDDETEVGQVHLGLAVVAEVQHNPAVRETDRMEGLWQEIDQLDSTDSAWETWSSILIPRLKLRNNRSKSPVMPRES